MNDSRHKDAPRDVSDSLTSNPSPQHESDTQGNLGLSSEQLNDGLRIYNRKFEYAYKKYGVHYFTHNDYSQNLEFAFWIMDDGRFGLAGKTITEDKLMNVSCSPEETIKILEIRFFSIIQNSLGRTQKLIK